MSIDTLIEDIQKQKYLATDKQVGEVAVAITNGHKAEMTYLRILLAHTRDKMRRDEATPLQAMNKAHEHLLAAYQAPLRQAAMKPEILKRKSLFAYSSATTLRNFIRARRDIRELDLDKVTKGMLVRAVQPEAPRNESKAAATARKASGMLTRSLQKLMAKDPVEARRKAQAMIQELSQLLRAAPKLRRAGNE